MQMPDSADAADFSTDDVVLEIRRGEIELFRQIVVRYQGEVLRIVNAMLLKGQLLVVASS